MWRVVERISSKNLLTMFKTFGACLRVIVYVIYKVGVCYGGCHTIAYSRNLWLALGECKNVTTPKKGVFPLNSGDRSVNWLQSARFLTGNGEQTY